MKKIEIPLDNAYRIMSPSPLLLISSAYKGRPNVLTVTWGMPMDFDPPMVGVEIGQGHCSYDYIMKTGEFVVNIPNKDLLKMALKVGSISGRKVNKFKKFKLTALPAETVKAPLVGECVAHLECKLVDKALAKKLGLFIGEVKKAWADKGVFTDRWLCDKKNAKFITHLGGGYFTFPSKVVKLKR